MSCIQVVLLSRLKYSGKSLFQVDYDTQELNIKLSGKFLYTAVLNLNEVFLARGVRANKKDLKVDVFQKALDVIMSKTVAEIYNMVDPGPEAVRYSNIQT